MTNIAAVDALHGLGVLVTRTAHQARELCEHIEACGGRALPYAVLEIAPPTDTAVFAALAARLEVADIAIFVSTNAVNAVREHLPQGLPGALRIAAVGGSTAASLARQGVQVDLVPAEGSSSEALLALPGLQELAGQHVLVLKGEGGRTLIEKTLTERGANVSAAPLYRRRCAAADGTRLDGWREVLQILTAASNESVDCLYHTAAAVRPWIMQLPLVVLSERNATHARELGFADVLVASEPSMAGLVAALLAYRQANPLQ